MPSTSNGGDSYHTEANSQASDSSQHQLQTSVSTASSSSGYYDAEKCRAYIASRIKINKIARLATQVNRVIEIENSIQMQLDSLLTSFLRQTAIEVRELHRRYKSVQPAPVQINKKKKLGRPSKKKFKRLSVKNVVHQNLIINHRNKHSLASVKDEDMAHFIRLEEEEEEGYSGDNMIADQRLAEFEPDSYLKCIEQCFEYNIDKSRCISSQLNNIRQVFENMASDHRDKVDLVHAIEEEKQGSSVVRRSTYNLSIAANKATSIPVRVTNNHLADGTSRGL